MNKMAEKQKSIEDFLARLDKTIKEIERKRNDLETTAEKIKLKSQSEFIGSTVKFMQVDFISSAKIYADIKDLIYKNFPELLDYKSKEDKDDYMKRFDSQFGYPKTERLPEIIKHIKEITKYKNLENSSENLPKEDNK